MKSNNHRKDLGAILKKKRQATNLTLYELSSASGVSPSHLGRIEKGDRFPSANVLQRIAKPLGFAEGELFSLAGYLSAHLAQESEIRPQNRTNGLDPYVAQVLSDETPEVQRAVVGLLTVLKSIAGNLTFSPDGKPQKLT